MSTQFVVNNSCFSILRQLFINNNSLYEYNCIIIPTNNLGRAKHVSCLVSRVLLRLGILFNSPPHGKTLRSLAKHLFYDEFFSRKHTINVHLYEEYHITHRVLISAISRGALCTRQQTRVVMTHHDTITVYNYDVMAHSVVITVPVVQEGSLSQLFSLQQYQLS